MPSILLKSTSEVLIKNAYKSKNIEDCASAAGVWFDIRQTLTYILATKY